MFKILLIAALAGCASANYETDILRLASQVNTDGTYAFDIAQSDGQTFTEQGEGSKYAKGVFSYTSPEGVPVAVSYVADENGYQPTSDLLPTPPPIPEAILRSIRYIQEHPTAEELADREVRARQI